MLTAPTFGLLLLRVVIGLILIIHGTQKLFGWFGGPGLNRFRQGLARQGFAPSWLWVALVILGEVGGGCSLTLGFFTPLGAAGIFGAMLMAAIKVHWKNGFFNSKGGYEFTLSLMASAAALGLIGPGAWSLDSLMRLALPEAPLFLALAGSAVVVDVIGLLIARRQAAATTPPAPVATAQPPDGR